MEKIIEKKEVKNIKCVKTHFIENAILDAEFRKSYTHLWNEYDKIDFAQSKTKVNYGNDGKFVTGKDGVTVYFYKISEPYFNRFGDVGFVSEYNIPHVLYGSAEEFISADNGSKWNFNTVSETEFSSLFNL